MAKIRRTSGETHLEHLLDLGHTLKSLIRKFDSFNQTNSGFRAIFGNKRPKRLIEGIWPSDLSFVMSIPASLSAKDWDPSSRPKAMVSHNRVGEHLGFPGRRSRRVMPHFQISLKAMRLSAIGPEITGEISRNSIAHWQICGERKSSIEKRAGTDLENVMVAIIQGIMNAEKLKTWKMNK
jgi:hypothetical protein